LTQNVKYLVKYYLVFSNHNLNTFVCHYSAHILTEDIRGGSILFDDPVYYTNVNL